MPDIKGIDVEGVTAWMREAVPTIEPPLSFDLVAGGRSNLTFIVTDAKGGKWVLRRPPTGHVLASAHDMRREHRIITALAPTKVPVPPAVGLCTDDSVNGAPFYVMDFVAGTIVRSPRDVGSLTDEQRAGLGRELVRTLADLHDVDPDAVGLGDLGKKEDYIGRQLKRWMTQIDEGSDRDLPRLREVHKQLLDSMPQQQGAGVVHGDYRLDNCMIGPDGKVAAVLDWELCTLGDVLADVGTLLMFSGYRPGGPAGQGLVDGAEMMQLYGEASGRDTTALPYYIAFANWRLACIIEGVRTRFEKGAMGGKDIGPELTFYAQRIDALVELTAEILAEL